MSSEAVFDIDVTARRGESNVSARIALPGRVVALFGRSGAGKTSLLDMVAGLLRPYSGRIVVAGQVLFDAAAGVNLPPERRACGYVFQDNRLFPHLSVQDNLLYGRRRATASGPTIEETCRFLGIAHLMQRMPATLSGGESQRVAIGRALLSGPRFLLLDEPLSSLDRPRREDIMAVIERIRDELALPMLYVSHDRAEVDRLADAVVELD
jgi:molybdate transport system ATP-binding protein